MYGNRRSSKVHTAFFSVFGANGCFASHSRAIASNVLEPLARSARRSAAGSRDSRVGQEVGYRQVVPTGGPRTRYCTRRDSRTHRFSADSLGQTWTAHRALMPRFIGCSDIHVRAWTALYVCFRAHRLQSIPITSLTLLGFCGRRRCPGRSVGRWTRGCVLSPACNAPRSGRLRVRTAYVVFMKASRALHMLLGVRGLCVHA